MSSSVFIGLVLAFCCAVVALLGFLFKQRGAAGAPAVQWRHPVRSTVALFKNGWWTLGIVVAMGAWLFHVGALALAPISYVQSVIAGGLVLLTPMADRIFGLDVSPREWLGVAVAAAGLALLAVTVGEGAREAYDDFQTGTLLAYVSVLTALAIACMVAVRGDTGRTGPVLAVAAGLLWGASDVGIKAGAGDIADDGLWVLLTPLAAMITALSLFGLVVSARSLQLGPPVAVIAVTSAAANLVTIAAGPAVFGEPLPESTGALVLRLVAFAAVIGGACLAPGPRMPAPAPA